MIKHRLILLPLLATLLINLTACASPQPQVSPVSPIQTPEASGSASSLIPAGNMQVGEQFPFDFDGDGVKEVAIAYAALGDKPGGGLIVGKPGGAGYSILWKTEVPSDLKVTEFKTRDMFKDGRFELLLFAQRQDTIKFPLYVYEWVNGTFIQLKPNGGKLAGQDTFTSDYWPTTLGDVDDDGVMEIVPTLEFDPPREFLEPTVYQWDGKNFTFTDFYIIPPRFKPEK